MDEFKSLSHTKWECKYHIVFIPKLRRKVLYAELRSHLGEVFRQLAAQKESQIEEWHLLQDHVRMMISIPPKYAVSQVVGYIKGKSAIHLAGVYGERNRNFVGQYFWARGYFVSTIGRDESMIRVKALQIRRAAFRQAHTFRLRSYGRFGDPATGEFGDAVILRSVGDGLSVDQLLSDFA